jgi:23S rRNA G2069 N7-methylase RlmK/C1962 C5-methylase RlmI
MDGRNAKQGAASPTKAKASKTATHQTKENQQANKTINRTHAWL